MMQKFNTLKINVVKNILENFAEGVCCVGCRVCDEVRVLRCCIFCYGEKPGRWVTCGSYPLGVYELFDALCCYKDKTINNVSDINPSN